MSSCNSSGCGCCSTSRRHFLTDCATCAGAMVIPTTGIAAAISPGPTIRHIRVLYALHANIQAQPDWPNVGFDFNPVMKEMCVALAAGCPDTEFIPTTATGPEQAKAIMEQDKSAKIDGDIVMQMLSLSTAWVDSMEDISMRIPAWDSMSCATRVWSGPVKTTCFPRPPRSP